MGSTLSTAIERLRKPAGPGATGRFPWYDAWWLTRYVRAKAFLADRYPGRLAAFESAMDPLRTRPDFHFQLPEKFFNAAQAGLIRKALCEVGTAQLESHELGAHGRFVVHDHPDLVGLQAEAAGALGELVGEKVDPAYSFIALYNRNGKCPVHLDAPVSKWTLDYCIGQSEPWPIHFSEVIAWPEDFECADEDWEGRIKHRSGHEFRAVEMRPGESVVFSGSGQWHYREPLAGSSARTRCDLLFMHFLPAGMKEVSEWKNWERLFSAPGLTAAVN